MSFGHDEDGGGGDGGYGGCARQGQRKTSRCLVRSRSGLNAYQIRYSNRVFTLTRSVCLEIGLDGVVNIKRAVAYKN